MWLVARAELCICGTRVKRDLFDPSLRSCPKCGKTWQTESWIYRLFKWLMSVRRKKNGWRTIE